MSISQFYKDNSVNRVRTINNTEINFKISKVPIKTLFDNDIDMSIAFSANTHDYFSNYQYGNNFAIKFTEGSNFAEYNNTYSKVSVKNSTKICLLYSNTEQFNQYAQNPFDYRNNTFIYCNSDKTVINEGYATDTIALVTDIDFSRLIVSVINNDNFWGDDNNFSYNRTQKSNDNIIKLFYRRDDFTLADISSFFQLAEIIQLDDEILIRQLSWTNLARNTTSRVKENNVFSDFSDGAIKLHDKVFNHAVTNDIVENDGTGFYWINALDDKTGVINGTYWSGVSVCRYNTAFRLNYMHDIIASIGLRFCYDPILITNESTYNANVKLAHMGDDGYVDWTKIYTGESEIENSGTYNKHINYDEIPDIPDKPNPYPESDDKIEPIDYRYTNEIGGFTRYYKVSRANLASIIAKINTATDLPDGYEFLSHIVSVRQYPFNTSNYASGHTENISIGGYDTGVSGLNLDSTQFAVQTIATIPIPRKYNNFLDKSPYTQLSLYIPFCSWVDLPDICVGRTITVDIAHDIINGSCIGIVKLEGMPIVQACGQMGTNISISATENGLKNASMTQAMFNVGGGILSTGYALATANPVGIASGIMSTVASIAQGNIANNSNYTHQIGSTQSKANDHISTKCYLRISFPVTDIPDNFAHTYGHICNEKHTLSECNGYTVCENVDLNGINCTETEKQMIKSMLENGCYI